MLIGRLNGTMHDPSNLRVCHIKASETRVSGAFGIIVTLVWLYLEILRLLSKMRSRN